MLSDSMIATLQVQAHAHLAALHPAPSERRLIEIASRGRNWYSRYFTRADLAADYAIEQAQLGVDVYAGVNSRIQFRGKNEDVSDVSALTLDWDRRHEHDPRPALALLAHQDVPGSEVVESGGGTHAYLYLAEPVSPAEGHALARRLHVACGGDPVHDLRRVMRVPGTWNAKRGAWCHIMELHPQRRYTLAQIHAALDAEGVPRVDAKPVVAPIESIAPPRDIGALFARLRRETVQAIMMCSGPMIEAIAARTDGGGKSWSEVDWRVVCRLISEADATDDLIAAVFASCPIGEHARRKTHPQRYIAQTVCSARRRLAVERSGVVLPGPSVRMSPAELRPPRPRILVEERRPPRLLRRGDGLTINTQASEPKYKTSQPGGVN